MDPEVEKLRVRVKELTPFPGWSKPVVIEPDPDVELLRYEVLKLEIKIAVEPLRERVCELVAKDAEEEVSAGPCEGDKEKPSSQ